MFLLPKVQTKTMLKDVYGSDKYVFLGKLFSFSFLPEWGQEHFSVLVF